MQIADGLGVSCRPFAPRPGVYPGPGLRRGKLRAGAGAGSRAKLTARRIPAMASAMPDDDRQMLRDIRDYCLSRAQAAPDAWPTPEARARQRAYAAVARAAGELLEEIGAGRPIEG